MKAPAHAVTLANLVFLLVLWFWRTVAACLDPSTSPTESLISSQTLCRAILYVSADGTKHSLVKLSAVTWEIPTPGFDTYILSPDNDGPELRLHDVCLGIWTWCYM